MKCLFFSVKTEIMTEPIIVNECCRYPFVKGSGVPFLCSEEWNYPTVVWTWLQWVLQVGSVDFYSNSPIQMYGIDFVTGFFVINLSREHTVPFVLFHHISVTAL